LVTAAVFSMNPFKIPSLEIPEPVEEQLEVDKHFDLPLILTKSFVTLASWLVNSKNSTKFVDWTEFDHNTEDYNYTRFMADWIVVIDWIGKIMDLPGCWTAWTIINQTVGQRKVIGKMAIRFATGQYWLPL